MTWDGRVGTGGGGTVDPATLDRLSISCDIPASAWVDGGIVDGGTLALFGTWNSPDEVVGSAFDYSADGVISIDKTGAYAVSTTFVAILDTCDPAMAADVSVLSSGQNPTIYCGLRGGLLAKGSAGTTYFMDSSAELDFLVTVANFDLANTGDMSVGVAIQRLSP